VDFIIKIGKQKLEAEFGSSSPIGFANVKAYDSDGYEIDMRCPKCGQGMTRLIGKECYQDICTNRNCN